MEAHTGGRGAQGPKPAQAGDERRRRGRTRNWGREGRREEQRQKARRSRGQEHPEQRGRPRSTEEQKYRPRAQGAGEREEGTKSQADRRAAGRAVLLFCRGVSWFDGARLCKLLIVIFFFFVVEVFLLLGFLFLRIPALLKPCSSLLIHYSFYRL